MFPWPRLKKKGKKSVDVPSRSGEEECPKTTHEDAHQSAIRANVPPVIKIESPMDSQTSEGWLTSADSKQTLCVPKHRQLRHQPTSITSDGGYSSHASMSTLGEDYRQRASSSLSSNSSASANSYHTARGSVNMDPSPTSSGDSAPNFPEPLTAVPATNETMQQTKELLKRLCGLVKNLETSHEKLSARVGDMEEKIFC